MKPAANKKGLWLHEDKTFYWLETGAVTVMNEIDRIRQTLISRGKQVYNSADTSVRYPYKIMTFEEAENQGYDKEVIYISAHVKRLAESGENSKQPEQNSGW